MTRRALLPADLIGKKSGRLTITNTWIEEVPGRNSVRWVMASCECGTANHVLRHSNFHSGKSSSCGCRNREHLKSLHGRRRTHGDSKSPLYLHYVLLRKRSGMAGKWLTYQGFKDDLGARPPGKFVLRKDPAQPYSPENFSGWGNINDSMRQRTNGKVFTLRNQTKNVSEWAAYVGISRQAMHQWIELVNPSIEEIDEYVFDHENYKQRKWRQAGAKRRGVKKAA
jgi:hypothetical protein